MTLDEGLNSNMEYIAVNFNANINNENKENILKYLERYDVDVMESSLKELREKGLSDELGNLKGILLTIDDIKVESVNKIIIKASKYRSGIGAISGEWTLTNENGTWKIESSAPMVAS